MSNVTGVPDTSTRRYQEIIEKVFLDRFTSGATEVPFERAELTEAAKTLGHAVPKNLGDVVYSFRYRHMRTSIEVVNPLSGSPEKAQVETDELYVGIDRHGAHYILPVQAKGGHDSLSIIQIWQDLHVAEQKFPALIPMPVAAQCMQDGSIALFQFDKSAEEITIARECHYNLVPQTELTDEELAIYGRITQTAAGEADT